MQITEQQLTEYKASIEAHRQNIEEIRQRWMHKLESLVENISERFSAFFEHMGYAGEIHLNKGNKNEDDYTNYGKIFFSQYATPISIVLWLEGCKLIMGI